jgi:hypothetical protein
LEQDALVKTYGPANCTLRSNWPIRQVIRYVVPKPRIAAIVKGQINLRVVVLSRIMAASYYLVNHLWPLQILIDWMILTCYTYFTIG